jgi:hypothetical protein
VSAAVRTGATTLWLVLILTSRLDAYADENATTEPAPSVQVHVTVVGKANDFRWARSLVGSKSLGAATTQWNSVEHFDPRDLLSTASPGGQHTILCWLDLSSPKHAYLYFAAPSGERFLLREVRLSGRLDDVDRESLAEVLELSVAALLENDRTGLTRKETELLLTKANGTQEGAQRPEQATPAPAATSLVVGLSYSTRLLSTTMGLVHGPGLCLMLDHDFAVYRIAVFAGGQYQLPAGESSADVGMRIQSLNARAGLEFAWAHRQANGARFWQAFNLRFGAGLDVDYLEPRPGGDSTTGVELTSSRWSRNWILSGGVARAFALSSSAAAEIRFFADVLPVAVHYDLKAANETRARFSPWRARPGLALQVDFR